jgi:hypothetical protein
MRLTFSSLRNNADESKRLRACISELVGLVVIDIHIITFFHMMFIARCIYYDAVARFYFYLVWVIMTVVWARSTRLYVEIAHYDLLRSVVWTYDDLLFHLIISIYMGEGDIT